MFGNEFAPSQLDPAEATRRRRREIQLAVKKLGIRGTLSAKSYKPAIVVREDERVLAIAINVLDLGDIEAVLDCGPPALLSVRGQRRFNEIAGPKNVRIAANGLCKFEATVVLPPEVDERTVDACFEGSNLLIIGKKRSIGDQ